MKTYRTGVRETTGRMFEGRNVLPGKDDVYRLRCWRNNQHGAAVYKDEMMINEYWVYHRRGTYDTRKHRSGHLSFAFPLFITSAIDNNCARWSPSDVGRLHQRLLQRVSQAKKSPRADESSLARSLSVVLDLDQNLGVTQEKKLNQFLLVTWLAPSTGSVCCSTLRSQVHRMTKIAANSVWNITVSFTFYRCARVRFIRNVGLICNHRILCTRLLFLWGGSPRPQ